MPPSGQIFSFIKELFTKETLRFPKIAFENSKFVAAMWLIMQIFLILSTCFFEKVIWYRSLLRLEGGFTTQQDFASRFRVGLRSAYSPHAAYLFGQVQITTHMYLGVSPLMVSSSLLFLRVCFPRLSNQNWSRRWGSNPRQTASCCPQLIPSQPDYHYHNCTILNIKNWSSMMVSIHLLSIINRVF